MIIFRRRAVFSRTTKPYDSSSAVPPAAVTSSSIVCTVPGFTRAMSSRRNEQAAVKADTIVSCICRAAANKSRITLSGTLGTCFVSPSLLSSPATGAVPIPENLLGQQQSYLQQSLSPAFSSPPLSRSFQMVSKQGPSVLTGALSQESDTATLYCSSVLNPHLSQTKFSKRIQTQQNVSDFTGNNVHCKTLMPCPWKRQPNPSL